MFPSSSSLVPAAIIILLLGAQPAFSQDVAVNTGGGYRINDGSGSSKLALTDFGNVDVASGEKLRTFFIRNLDVDTALTIGTVGVTGSADFTVSDQRNFPSLQWTTTDAFTIAFNPSGTGTKAATITFTTNDPDGSESTFNFSVSGIGINTAPAAAPDLRVMMTTPLKIKIAAESTIVSGQVSIENHGTAASEASTLQIFESRNDFYEGSDTLVATIPVKASTVEKPAKAKFKITPTLSRGRLFFRITPDPEIPNDLDYDDNQVLRDF